MIQNQYNKSSITHLSDNSILIIPRNKNKIHFRCADQNATDIVNQPENV